MNAHVVKIGLISALIILIGICIFAFFKLWELQKPDNIVLTPSIIKSPSPTIIPSTSDFLVDTSTDSAIQTNLSVPIPGFSASPALPMNDFIYPGSSIKSQTNSKLELESLSSVGEVTEWYKNKIRDQGFNGRSFAQTTTNGNSFNKLSAVKINDKIDISIKLNQNESIIAITVDRQQ